MPTAVPAVDRAAAVLFFLRERPFEAFSLSDISRGTGVHKATCAALLTAMANHGLVSRDSSLRYALGPELLRLGQAYRERYRAFTLGRREMWRLAEKVGLSCSATILDNDEMVIVDIYGDMKPPHLPQRVGRRLPLVPPIGTIFRAWSSTDQVDKWLLEMQRQYGGDRASQVAALAAIRARGFSLGGEQDFHLELDTALRRLAQNNGDQRGLEVAVMVADKIRNYQVAGPTPESDDEPINYLVGPVFGHDMQVVMSVNLFGQPGQLRRADIVRVGPELLATTARITEQIGGIYPYDSGLESPFAATEPNR